MFRRKMLFTEWEEIVGRVKGNDRDLHTLNLANCSINDEHLLELARALLKNTNVTSINLSSNQITDISARVLVKLLSRNDYIQRIDLSFTFIAMDYIKRINYMMEMNKICDETGLTADRKLMARHQEMPVNPLAQSQVRRRSR